VPANTTATVTLPSAKGDQLTVNDQAASASIKASMKQSDKILSLNIGSGTYTFRIPLK
jgi:alpha-L-rhamnosidase